MTTAEHLLRALTRALLGNRELEPTMEFVRSGGTTTVTVETRPFDPAPMIGSGGAMKFAIQQMLAGTEHPDSWSIRFRTSGKLRSPHLEGAKPDAAAMDAVIGAAVNHWRALDREAEGKVELSESTVIAVMKLDERLANAQRGPMSRIVRAIGKANGWGGTILIDKIRQPA